MDKPFIGMGRSPDGIDLPQGLSMELGMHPEAVNAFGRMTPYEKNEAIRYIQSATSGQDAKKRIQNTIKNLQQGQTSIS